MNAKPLETFIGIDINNLWIQISYFKTGFQEPATVSVIAGEEKYLIPTALCQKKSSGAWYYAEEAKRLQSSAEGIYIDRLLEKALAGDEVVLNQTYQAEELLFILLKKVLKLAMMQAGISEINKITFTVEELTPAFVSLLEQGAGTLGIKKEMLAIQDYKESFYYYSLSQAKEMWQNDIALFEYKKNYVVCFILHKDMRQKKAVALVEELYLGTLPENNKEKDALFTNMIKTAFGKKIFSTVYLIGDGFAGAWMKNSLPLLCRGRRVFQGKNLYTKGACYSGYYAKHEEEWKFSYFCTYKTVENISIKVQTRENTCFYPLVKAGMNLHEINAHCEVLLEGEPIIELWIQKPDSAEATVKVLELVGLVSRAARTTRLRIEVYALRAVDLIVRVSDLGLGELFPSSGQKWEFEL